MNVLVVGAGPVGLAAALELRHRGIEVRIVERKEQREEGSKALAIQPRSLELLEDLDISRRVIEAGYKMQKIHFVDCGKQRLTLDFSHLRHRYNYVVLLPQCETERILEARLNEMGVEVERGTEMVEFSQNEQRVLAQLHHKEESFSYACDYMIGADGAHSWTRKSLRLGFEGKKYPNDWNFIDVRMSWSGQVNEIFLQIHKGGRISLIFPIRPGVYRIAATCEDARIGIPADAEVHEIVWESTFRIQCRQVECYQKGRVFLAGDAAHIHSPAGGRGMNLGIEDALILAEKISRGEVDSYSDERRPVGRKVIRATEELVRIQSTTNPFMRFARNYLLYPILGWKLIQPELLKEMAGLGGRALLPPTLTRSDQG